MAIFKKKGNEYEDASKRLNTSSMAVDKLIIEQMVDDDELAAKYVDNLKNGCPLIINFDGLGDFAANKMLAFLTGATYAVEGKTIKINETTYLFARRVEFLDGSLQRFIQTLPRK